MTPSIDQFYSSPHFGCPVKFKGYAPDGRLLFDKYKITDKRLHLADRVNMIPGLESTRDVLNQLQQIPPPQ